MKESPKDFPNANSEKGMVILYIKNTLPPEIRHAAKLVPKFATPKTKKSPIPSFTTPHTNRKIFRPQNHTNRKFSPPSLTKEDCRAQITCLHFATKQSPKTLKV